VRGVEEEDSGPEAGSGAERVGPIGHRLRWAGIAFPESARAVVTEIVKAFVSPSLLCNALPVRVPDDRKEHRLVVGVLIVVLELEEVRRAVRVQLIAQVVISIQLWTASRPVAEVVAGGARTVPRVLIFLVEHLVEIVRL